MTIQSLLSQRQLLVCVGPGGVGKTTVAAAMGVLGASLGKKTLVLTIDPARRLADALGLKMGDDQIHPVDLQAVIPRFARPGGELHAAMFDNAQSMDELMARVSPTPESAERILKNRVYRAMAGTLARSHAYLAMERLYEVIHTGDYDLIILDTPPARNALDILDAPGRLSAFLEEGVVRWFTKARQARDAQGLRGRLFNAGGAAATKLFSLVAGEELLNEVIEFFDGFTAVREGFFERAKSVQAILRAPTSAFVLVSSADLTHLDDASALAEGLLDRSLRVDACVYNRAYQRLGPEDHSLEVDATALPARDELVALLGDLGLQSEAEQHAFVQRVEAIRKAAVDENRAGLAAVAALHERYFASLAPILIARLAGDIRDVEGLFDLSKYFSYPRSLSQIRMPVAAQALL